MTIIQRKFINFMNRKIRLNFSFMTLSPFKSNRLLTRPWDDANFYYQSFATHSHFPPPRLLLFYYIKGGNNKCLVVIEHDDNRNQKHQVNLLMLARFSHISTILVKFALKNDNKMSQLILRVSELKSKKFMRQWSHHFNVYAGMM